jgi:hypothetical protein
LLFILKELNPDDVNIYSNKAVCYKKMGNWELCLEICNFALLKNKTSQKILLYKALSLA